MTRFIENTFIVETFCFLLPCYKSIFGSCFILIKIIEISKFNRAFSQTQTACGSTHLSWALSLLSLYIYYICNLKYITIYIYYILYSLTEAAQAQRWGVKVDTSQPIRSELWGVKCCLLDQWEPVEVSNMGQSRHHKQVSPIWCWGHNSPFCDWEAPASKDCWWNRVPAPRLPPAPPVIFSLICWNIN